MPNWQDSVLTASGAWSNLPFAEAAQPASTQNEQCLPDLELGYTAATADLGSRPGFRTLGEAADSSSQTDALRLRQHQYVRDASHTATRRAPGLKVKRVVCPACGKECEDRAALR